MRRQYLTLPCPTMHDMPPLLPHTQEMVLSCLRDAFSLERVRYHSKEALAEDIHRVFVSTANLIRSDLHQPHTHEQLE